MEEWDSSELSRQLAATERALANAHACSDPLLYAAVFKLHNRLRRQAERVDADFSLTRDAPEYAVGRQRVVTSS
jgi:hypothetical protein